MTKTLKHFSLLFVFIFSMVSAEIKEDQYRLYVTMVDPEFHCFALSNHMICYIPKENWETRTLPEVGTEICFILTYVSLEARCTVPAGWFSSAEYHYVMTLSDGSRWIKKDQEKHVRLGDRVIVSKCKENEYRIVSVDNDEFEIVIPYNPENITKE